MVFADPKFFDSPFFVDDPGNWHLKEGAPPEIVKEFNDYMAVLGMNDSAASDAEPEN